MTNEITTIQSTMSSLQIAELTGKQHAHIMRDIRCLLEQGVAESNFGLGSYSDANGQLRPCYQLTKTGCLILASGYNAVLREKIINRWIELETANAKQYQVPASYSEALMLAARQAEQLENAHMLGEVRAHVETREKAYRENQAVLTFMQNAWDTFGRDAMVVRYDHFFGILKKYNLVCGSFDRFTGTIPADKLESISHTMGILKEKGDFAVRFNYITKIDMDSNGIGMLQWFNINPISNDCLRGILLPLTGINYSNPAPISSSTYLRNKHNLEYELNDYVSDAYRIPIINKLKKLERSTVCSEETQYAFIAAPAQEMAPMRITVVSSKDASKRIDKEEEARKEAIRTLDPFICSLTPYGVLIHAKWGPEAEDATIKRYEQLRDAIIGKGGMV